MTKTGIDTASLQAAIIPALGVVPPSKRASHSSNRRAPPRSAASDDATESTQASTRMGAVSYDSSRGSAVEPDHLQIVRRIATPRARDGDAALSVECHLQ